MCADRDEGRGSSAAGVRCCVEAVDERAALAVLPGSWLRVVNQVVVLRAWV